MSSSSQRVGIIGTGNYGVALGKRLLHYGYEVVFGSRSPDREYLNECLNSDKFTVTEISNIWNKTDSIVFLAISAKQEIYNSIADEIVNSLVNQKPSKTSKIIVDVSNLLDSEKSSVKVSNAERLNDLFQQKLSKNKISNSYTINVVKGFNLINAYTLSLDSDNTNNNNVVIRVCGNDLKSKEQVLELINKIGFTGRNLGTLEANSITLELQNKYTFDDWYYPSIVSLLFLLFNLVWVFFNYFYFPKKPHTWAKYLNDFSLLGHLNKVLGFTSLQLISFVYLANIFASIYQLKNGTKYKLFPKYLDSWLRTRKQYGLWAFLLAVVHSIASLLINNHAYLKDWYRPIAKGSTDLPIMTLIGEVSLITGFLALVLMSLVALTSINSISESLNWSEWRFVQTKLGLSCLTVAFIHGAVMYSRIFMERHDQKYDFVYLITRVKLTALYLPFIVLLLRFVFSYFPVISTRLENIRNGTITKRKQIGEKKTK